MGSKWVLPPEAEQRYLRARRATQDNLETAKREAKPLSRGWEPWSLPNDICVGTVETGRSLVEAKSTRRDNGCLVVSLVTATAIGLLVGLTADASVLGAVVQGVAVFLMVGFCAICITMFIAVSLEIVEADKRGGLEMLGDNDPFVRLLDRRRNVAYAAPMPRAAWKKYQRARKWFDRVYVASYDTALFRVKPQQCSAGSTEDSFLVGRIGEQFYLGVRWTDPEAALAQQETAV